MKRIYPKLITVKMAEPGVPINTKGHAALGVNWSISFNLVIELEVPFE